MSKAKRRRQAIARAKFVAMIRPNATTYWRIAYETAGDFRRRIGTGHRGRL